tara:strand:+ start:35 stop:1039 length:1005 start_codon:yes stop_codon:yes gene_type:complete
MGAYKQFLASDIVVTPFEVNKAFYFEGASALTASGVGIDRFLGTNVTGSFNLTSDPTTGQVSTQYQRLIYSSIQELYYSNYLSSSYGDNVATASLIPGADTAGDRYVGLTQTPNYFNYLQTTLSYQRYFPTGSGDIIGVISIPSRLFGDYIQPKSFVYTTPSGSLIDDGEGNIIDENLEIVGNIFYYQGLITITTSNPIGYGFVTYGNTLYGGQEGDNTSILEYVTGSNITCSFSSSYKIYETQYKCTMRENEFNFSQNPSLSSGSTSISSSMGIFFTPGQYLADNVTGSYFSPYVTTVGLYDENQNLLAVGKLSQPLPVSPTTDTTILINLDR